MLADAATRFSPPLLPCAMPMADAMLPPPILITPRLPIFMLLRVARR